MDRVQFRKWSEKVDDVIFRCERDSDLPADLISEMYDLVGSGPSGVCDVIRSDLSRSSLQLLLDAGAFESAAIRLVKKCSYMLSGSSKGLFIASVVLPMSQRDYSHSANSEAVAICGALAIALQGSISLD